MAQTYKYTFEEWSNPAKIDEYGVPTNFAHEVEVLFPGKTFKVQISGTTLVVEFDIELSPSEEAQLSDLYTECNEFTVSTFIEIITDWELKYVDYKKARLTLMGELINRGGFDNLTTLEKKIASRWFIADKTQRDSVHTSEEQLANGKYFHNNSVESRHTRFLQGIIFLYNCLTLTDANDVIDDLNNYRLEFNYVKYGREGTDEGDPEGLFDYIESRDGTTFSGIGLLDKPYTPTNGDTMAQVTAKVMDIVKNGIYTI